MKMIFRAYDGTELSTFQECFSYEVEKLGVLFLTEDFNPTDDYEKTYYIYAPSVRVARILVDYADTEMLDNSMWKFGNDLDYFSEDEEVLFHWDEAEELYVPYEYREISLLVRTVDEHKENKNVCCGE